MTTERMSDERLAAIRQIAKMTPDRLLDATIAEIDRLEVERRNTRELVRALRQMVVAAEEAGHIFVRVELGEGGKLVLRAADRFLEGVPQ